MIIAVDCISIVSYLRPNMRCLARRPFPTVIIEEFFITRRHAVRFLEEEAEDGRREGGRKGKKGRRGVRVEGRGRVGEDRGGQGSCDPNPRSRSPGNEDEGLIAF